MRLIFIKKLLIKHSENARFFEDINRNTGLSEKEVEQNLDNWKSFFYTTEKLDKIRKENWKISLPEIRIMIEYCNGLEARKKNVKLVRAGKK